MSDCCSCCWAGLTGCHSRRDAMPQPRHGGGCLCRSSGMRRGALSVCQPSAHILGGLVGGLNHWGCCSAYIYIYINLPPISILSGMIKSRDPTIASVVSPCWQRCNMSDINVRCSRCEGAQRQSNLVFTRSRVPSPVLVGHRRCTKASHSLDSSIPKHQSDVSAPIPLPNDVFGCPRLLRFTGSPCPQGCVRYRLPTAPQKKGIITKGAACYFSAGD